VAVRAVVGLDDAAGVAGVATFSPTLYKFTLASDRFSTYVLLILKLPTLCSAESGVGRHGSVISNLLM